MKNQKDYQRGLKKGFKTTTNSEIPKKENLFFRLGFNKGQEVFSEFSSTKILIDTFLPKG